MNVLNYKNYENFIKMIKNSSKSSKTCQNPGIPGVSKIRQKMAQNGHFWSKMVLPYLWLKFFWPQKVCKIGGGPKMPGARRVKFLHFWPFPMPPLPPHPPGGWWFWTIFGPFWTIFGPFLPFLTFDPKNMKITWKNMKIMKNLSS